MRDEDDDTRPLRFGARRDDRPSEWQRRCDAEDHYWGAPQQVPCVRCGEVIDLEKGTEYDEAMCGSCQRIEYPDTCEEL